MNGHTVSKQRLGQFSEEGFEQAADYIQVLPSLWRQRMRVYNCSILKTNINIQTHDFNSNLLGKDISFKSYMIY